jgi:hypothetical protein
MATLTFVEKQKNALVKKFHILLSKGRIGNDQKLDMLSAYGVTSSKDLTVYELTELCGKLDKIVNPEADEAYKLRKRLIAAIYSYRNAMGCASTIDEIKAIACRAASAENFNRISVEKLRSLYNAFNNMKKDLLKVRVMTEEHLKRVTTLN